MQPEPSFNAVAPTYDADFTHSVTGTLQRKRVWHFMEKYIRSPLNILEINCGTGEDALYLASKGHRVLATDVAEEMINVAQAKAAPPNVSFHRGDFTAIHSWVPPEKYDLLFSNFAGLNCADYYTLQKLNEDFYELLKPGGKLIMVVLGKNCRAERLFFTLKGEPEKARRRSADAVAQLNGHTTQLTFYYHTKELKQIFSRFSLIETKPVGLFIPPSYLEPIVARYRFLIPLLQLAEFLFGRFSVFSNDADHTFIALQKK